MITWCVYSIVDGCVYIYICSAPWKTEVTGFGFIGLKDGIPFKLYTHRRCLHELRVCMRGGMTCQLGGMIERDIWHSSTQQHK